MRRGRLTEAARRLAGLSSRFSLPLRFPSQRRDFFIGIRRLAVGGPGVHQLPAHVEQRRPDLGPFDLTADLVSHRVLDRRMGKSGDFLGPGLEGGAEPMGRDGTA